MPSLQNATRAPKPDPFVTQAGEDNTPTLMGHLIEIASQETGSPNPLRAYNGFISEPVAYPCNSCMEFHFQEAWKRKTVMGMKSAFLLQDHPSETRLL